MSTPSTTRTTLIGIVDRSPSAAHPQAPDGPTESRNPLGGTPDLASGVVAGGAGAGDGVGAGGGVGVTATGGLALAGADAGVGAVTVSASEPDTPPPGAGLATLIWAVPAAATSLAGMLTSSRVLLR